MKKGPASTNTTIFLLVVVIVLLAAALLISIQRNSTSQQNQVKVHEKVGTETSETNGNVEKSSEQVFEKERVVIKITANGFEPPSVTVTAANAVIAFQNVDSRAHAVKADPTGQEEFATGEIAPGETVDAVSYTEAGNYTYSDVNSSAKGVVVVEE